MFCVDSSGWIEFFLGSTAGQTFKPIIEQTAMLVVPAVSIFEVHRFLSRTVTATRRDEAIQVMCRSTVSVDYQGWLSDCDFNQQLGLPLGTSGLRRHLRDLLKTRLDEQAIRVAGHCYGCTAGQGSSCGGALEH